MLLSPLITRRLSVGIAISLIALVLGSCQSLITPNLQTELFQLREGNYRIDDAHTRIVFKVNHLGLSTYVGRFNSFDATLDFDPENLSASKLEAVVNTASIDLNNPSLEDTLRGSSWLDSETYPEAVFTTISTEAVNESLLRFTGNLRLRNIERPLELLIEFHGGASNMLTGKYTIGFTARGTLKRSDFGIDSFTSLVGEDVDIEVYTEFQRRSGKRPT